MTTVTIGIATAEAAKARVLRAFDGQEQGAFISFATAELLWKVITPRRWDVLRAIVGAGPVPVGEIARRTGRDMRSVQSDVRALLKAGVLDRADAGQVLFPYDAVHVDFVLRAA